MNAHPETPWIKDPTQKLFLRSDWREPRDWRPVQGAGWFGPGFGGCCCEAPVHTLCGCTDLPDTVYLSFTRTSGGPCATFDGQSIALAYTSSCPSMGGGGCGGGEGYTTTFVDGNGCTWILNICCAGASPPGHTWQLAIKPTTDSASISNDDVGPLATCSPLFDRWTTYNLFRGCTGCPTGTKWTITLSS